MKPVPGLLPGDLLLYNSPGSVVDFVIRLKTWSVAAHCECYVGNSRSVASRNGIGVGNYPLRFDGLIAVLRPNRPFDLTLALEWFKSVDGQKYDFLGLMCFFLAVKRGSRDRMFCSEFLKRLYHQANCPLLHPQWDADKTAPGNFFMSTALDWFWLQERVTP